MAGFHLRQMDTRILDFLRQNAATFGKVPINVRGLVNGVENPNLFVARGWNHPMDSGRQ
jgi:hypothetical protein